MDPKVAAIMAQFEAKERAEAPVKKEPAKVKAPENLEEFMKAEGLVNI